jgi:hypothetical protein
MYQETSTKTNNKMDNLLVFGRERTAENDILRGERLKQVESFTYLGRIIS